MLTRRSVVAGGGLLIAGCAAPLAPAVVRRPVIGIKPVAGTHFKSIEDRIGGRVGVCAIDTATMVRISHRAQERFAMASTFKWLLAAAILQRCQGGGMTLDDYALYGRADLLPTSPVSEANIDPSTGIGRMTLAQMCEAVVTVSDNCAANLLLVPMFGPEGFTRFLREAGDPITRLDRPELALNENARGDERDTTTPEAMALTAAKLLATDQVLTANSRELLVGWMRKASTGLDRLRAGLPADWNAGDKTGTGGNGAYNDVAIAFPLGRKPIVIASYLSEGAADNTAKAAAHAEIARIVVKEFG